jgi:hypothetical protein
MCLIAQMTKQEQIFNVFTRWLEDFRFEFQKPRDGSKRGLRFEDQSVIAFNRYGIPFTLNERNSIAARLIPQFKERLFFSESGIVVRAPLTDPVPVQSRQDDWTNSSAGSRSNPLRVESGGSIPATHGAPDAITSTPGRSQGHRVT